MAEKKSKLNLQLPYHHVYDSNDSALEHFEPPPISGYSTVPLSRRKNSKALTVAASSEGSKFSAIPDTPPTPNGSTLYPFMRLHRQPSTSAPDVLKEQKESMTRADTTKQVKQCKDQQDNSLAQINNTTNMKPMVASGSLSEHVLQQGLTAATNSEVAKDRSADALTEPRTSISENTQSEFNSIPKRGSSGFLSNLIFGNHMMDGKPLKVSPFDVTMCAPGSL